MILREDDERPCPPVIRDVLVKQDGWALYDESEPADEQPAYNLFWKTNRFYPTQINSCVYPHQRCNHYPKSSEITKKDGLYRHMKRMKVVHGAALFNFVPETFNLPNEYVKFCQYFADERDKVHTQRQQQQVVGSSATLPTAAISTKSENESGTAAAAASTVAPPTLRDPMYICKPAELSRGRKIFVFDDIGELTYDCASVVQRYVDRPLLIFGHKVDFRIYVLVTSFQPLRMYIYENFLTRFGGEKYGTDNKDTFVHLTNYSVTKTSTSDALRNAGVGDTCKWDGDRTREYFASCGVDFALMWARIETLVRCTVLSIFHLVPQRLQCFELYGFDVLFDDQLQPWLIEANFSPALAVESDVDVRVKHGLIHDLVATLNIQPTPPLPQQSSARDEPVAATTKTHSGTSRDAESSPKIASPVPTGKPISGTARGGGGGSLPPSSSRQQSSSTSSRPAGSGGSAGATRRTQSTTRTSASTTTAANPSANAAQSQRASASTTARASVTSAGNGTAAVRAARTQRSNSSAVMSSSTRSSAATSNEGGAPTSSGGVLTSGFVDKASGRMKMIFPFNAETEKLSIEALQPGKLDASLKGMLAEVRKSDAKASQQLKQLAPVYAERSAAVADGKRR